MSLLYFSEVIPISTIGFRFMVVILYILLSGVRIFIVRSCPNTTYCWRYWKRKYEMFLQ